jgi:hypothetical protein
LRGVRSVDARNVLGGSTEQIRLFCECYI